MRVEGVWGGGGGVCVRARLSHAAAVHSCVSGRAPQADQRRLAVAPLGEGEGRFFGGEGRAAGAGAVSVVLLPPHMAHCKNPASAPSW